MQFGALAGSFFFVEYILGVKIFHYLSYIAINSRSVQNQCIVFCLIAVNIIALRSYSIISNKHIDVNIEGGEMCCRISQAI